MKEKLEKFERKIDILKIASLIALLLLIALSIATVFIPTPKEFVLKLDYSEEIEIFNKKCNIQNLNLSPDYSDDSKKLSNLVSFNNVFLDFIIEESRFGSPETIDGIYDLNVVWFDAQLKVYYKKSSNDDFILYNTFSKDQGKPGLQFQFSTLKPFRELNSLGYRSCGRHVRLSSYYSSIGPLTAIPEYHLGDTVLLSINLNQDEETSLSLFGQMKDNKSSHPVGHYLLVFEDLRKQDFWSLTSRSLSLIIKGKDIHGFFINENKTASIYNDTLADKLSILNPNGVISIDGTDYELSSQAKLFYDEIVIEKPFWRKESTIKLKRNDNSFEIFGEAGSIKYRGINMINSFISDQFPIVAAIISGVLLGIFTFFISMNEVKKKAVFSIIQYIPKENVDLVVTEDGQSFVGEINEYGVLNDKHLFLTKAYVKKAEQNSSEWKKVGDVRISTDKITYIRKSEQ